MGCISHWHADFCSILFIQLSLYKSCHYGYGCCHKSVITKWTYCVNMWDMAHVLCFLMTLAFCLFEILVRSFTQQFTLKSWYELFCRICLLILHGVSLTNLWNVHVFWVFVRLYIFRIYQLNYEFSWNSNCCWNKCTDILHTRIHSNSICKLLKMIRTCANQLERPEMRKDVFRNEPKWA